MGKLKTLINNYLNLDDRQLKGTLTKKEAIAFWIMTIALSLSFVTVLCIGIVVGVWVAVLAITSFGNLILPALTIGIIIALVWAIRFIYKG